MIILLDAGPLGLASNPKPSPTARACNEWIEDLLAFGVRVAVPEIADYEVRRELIRSRKRQGIKRLDSLKASLTYVPLTTGMMLQAADFWAAARNAGKPTADPKALDCDVVLAAQAVILSQEEGEPVVIATTNPEHLSFFTPALDWESIEPDDAG